MLILTNGLTDIADEGFLKVANSLAKRIKAKYTEKVFTVTYQRKSDLSDLHLELNKLFLNKKLISVLREKNQDVLHIPFPAKTMATSLRVFILSMVVKKKLSVVWVQKSPLNFIAKGLVKFSGAEIVVFSKESADYFKSFVSEKKVKYLKTGIDVNKFIPVSAEEKAKLKEKYGFDANIPVILHVGHLKSGRNIGELLNLDKRYQILLVTSTLFKDDQDMLLRQKLIDSPNVKLIDYYVPEIQEIYQLSDLYFFPVVEKGNCIDVPLSCLEAAACNIPVVTTRYGEMKELEGKDGFFFIDSFEPSNINSLIEKALHTNTDARASVEMYDWNKAVDLLI